MEEVPDAGEAEPPGGVDGAVLVDDDTDVPGAAEEVEPLGGGARGGVRDGDEGDGAGVAVGEGAEGEEGFLGDFLTVSLVITDDDMQKGRGGNVQAQPTQRRKTTRTLRPPPNSSFRSRSRGATSPTRGTRATGTGGGGGENQGWTVSGRFLTDIQLVQPPPSPPSSAPGFASAFVPGGLFFSLLGGRGAAAAGLELEKSRASLGRPSFLRAILVVRLESMVAPPYAARRPTSAAQCSYSSRDDRRGRVDHQGRREKATQRWQSARSAKRVSR